MTLLALLFIILVISVAITRLILNTDEDGLSETNSSINSGITETDDNSLATTAGVAATGLAGGAMLANRTRLTERNVSTTSSDSSTDSKKDETTTKKIVVLKLKLH